jgi:hypothetical protein
VRRGHRFNSLQLVHERFIDLQASRGVDDDRRQRKALGLGDPFAHDAHRIAGAALINGKIDLLAEHLQLLDCCRTIHVCCNQQRTPPLFLEAQREFPGLRRFSRSLQSDQHNDRRRGIGELQTTLRGGARRTEQVDELGVNDG